MAEIIPLHARRSASVPDAGASPPAGGDDVALAERDDDDLMLLARGGVAGALDALVRRHQRKVLRLDGETATLRYADDDAVATHRLLTDAGVDSLLLVRLDAGSARLHRGLAPHGPPTWTALAGALDQLDGRMQRARDRPAIFDPAGAPQRFNNGAWNGFFSAADFIDLDDAQQGFFIPGGGANRVVYAVAYLINTGGDEVDAQIAITSPNDVEVFAGGASTLGLGGEVTLRAKLPAYGPDVELTRIMVKVFQGDGDDQFGFDLQVTDTAGNFLGNQLLIKLSPEGSI